MRADRLLSILMLLQARGRMSARALAEELEVSERTIYRDMDALSAAGVPVYGEAGPQGGFQFVEHYQTTLTGLSEGEVRALFMLGLPAPLEDLGVREDLRTALRKLAAALPADLRGDEARVRQRFHLDATWWQQREEAVPHLPTVHIAVWQDRRLLLSFRHFSGIVLEQTVDPYGLVAKAGVWHLVYRHRDKYRVRAVAELLDVHLLDESFVRQPEFDLVHFWTGWCDAVERRRTGYTVRVRVAPAFVDALPTYFGAAIRTKIALAGAPDEHGHITLDLRFASLEEARDRLLDFGSGVEVLAPLALRLSIVDYAQQIVALYVDGDPLA